MADIDDWLDLVEIQRRTTSGLSLNELAHLQDVGRVALVAIGTRYARFISWRSRRRRSIEPT